MRVFLAQHIAHVIRPANGLCFDCVIGLIDSDMTVPRFYFDMHEPGLVVEDREGSDLADEQAACREAATALGEMVRDIMRRSPDSRGIRMIVRDEDGTQVCDLSVSIDSQCGDRQSRH
jgi:hypothetical protein